MPLLSSSTACPLFLAAALGSGCLGSGADVGGLGNGSGLGGGGSSGPGSAGSTNPGAGGSTRGSGGSSPLGPGNGGSPASVRPRRQRCGPRRRRGSKTTGGGGSDAPGGGSPTGAAGDGWGTPGPGAPIGTGVAASVTVNPSTTVGNVGSDFVGFSYEKGYRFGETNAFSGHGQMGVSDTLIAGLWVLDLMFENAEHGSSGVNFHGGETGMETVLL